MEPWRRDLYLAHYGVKGMKWKKRKSKYMDNSDNTATPKDYMFEAGRAYHDIVEKKKGDAGKYNKKPG